MACPECGVMRQPYGGFGTAPGWRDTGKYFCRNGHTETNWYGKPGETAP